MDADAPASQPVGIDAGRAAVFLDQSPGRLAVEVPAFQGERVRRQGPEEGTFLVVLDPGSGDVSQDGTGGIQEDFAPLVVALFGDVQVVLDAVGFEVADAGPGDGGDPTPGQ